MTEHNLQADGYLLGGRIGFAGPGKLVIAAGLALVEGAVAGVVLLAPALLYHAMLQVETPLWLYGAFSLLLAVLYGGFSFGAASRYLEEPRQAPHLRAGSALGWTGAMAVVLLVAFFLGLIAELSRVSLTVSYLVGLPVLMGLHSFAFAGIRARMLQGALRYRRIGVIGRRDDLARFLADTQLIPDGYEVSTRLQIDSLGDVAGSFRAGAIRDFGRQAVARGVSDIVILGDFDDFRHLDDIVVQLKRYAVNVLWLPADGSGAPGLIDVVPLGGSSAVRLLRKPLNDGDVLLKRGLDLCGAIFGLLLLAPFFAIVALLIKLDSRGPVFYRQERRGFNGASFYIWKFRSMTVTESGRSMTQARRGDKRITAMGRFMRPLNIDELPQLFNVLSGEMSLVGPRPHAVVHDDELGHRIESYALRQRIKPGITGWAQVNGFRGETTTDAQVEGRTRCDLHYIDNWSLLLDLWIIILTVVSPKARQNAV